MKYILNESPVRTTKGFNLNNISVDIKMPDNYNFHSYEINSLENIKVKESLNENYESRIGLSHKKYQNIDIKINENRIKENPLKLIYKFNSRDSLVDKINIDIDENKVADIKITYESKKDKSSFHDGTINIIAKSNSIVNLTVINNLNKDSINMLQFDVSAINNAKIIINLIDLNGKTRIYNAQARTYENATNELNTIFIGKENDLIDLNYNYINDEKNSSNYINVEGILKDSAKKSFKGIIDFKKGSCGSIGKESEHTTLLSDNATSKSLPIMLCGEEDVVGEHSTSSGNIDKDKLFYIISHGINIDDAKKMIIKSNMNKVLSKVPDIFQEDISNYLDKIL